MPIINIVHGNLITLAQEGRYTEIAQGCNCFCVFGAGIAPQIAKAFPQAEDADDETIRGDKEKLGTFTYADVDDTHLTVYNLYTQYGTGGRSKGVPDIDYIALRKAFTVMNTHVKNLKGPELDFFEMHSIKQLCGIPMIGAGLAGGDWDIISKIIDEVTPDVKIELVKYVP